MTSRVLVTLALCFALIVLALDSVAFFELVRYGKWLSGH